MIAKSLIKLIDEAIFPAFALIIAKTLGIFLSGYFLDLPFTIAQGQVLYVLPAVHFTRVQDYITAENYSNLAMFLTVAVGTIIVLVKAHFLHESHIHPTLQAKLVSLNLERLIAPSYHLYHQAAIWLTFLWLTVAFLIISTLLKVTYPQITIIATVVAANFSWVFAVDIEKEIQLGGET